MTWYRKQKEDDSNKILSMCLSTTPWGCIGEWGVKLHKFLILTLSGGEWWDSHSTHFTPDWQSHRASSVVMAKRK